MAWYSVYSSADGKLIQAMNIPESEAQLYEAPGLSVCACDSLPDLLADYVVSGAVVPRPFLPCFDKTTILANGTDVTSLTGLPDPCPVTINGESHVVTGGTLELDAEYPGTYRVEIQHFPYRDFVQEIIAT